MLPPSARSPQTWCATTVVRSPQPLRARLRRAERRPTGSPTTTVRQDPRSTSAPTATTDRRKGRKQRQPKSEIGEIDRLPWVMVWAARRPACRGASKRPWGQTPTAFARRDVRGPRAARSTCRHRIAAAAPAPLRPRQAVSWIGSGRGTPRSRAKGRDGRFSRGQGGASRDPRALHSRHSRKGISNPLPNAPYDPPVSGDRRHDHRLRSELPRGDHGPNRGVDRRR